MNWRRSEFISISTFLVVAGWIWWASAKTSTLDAAVEDIKTLKPVVWQNKSRVDILETKVDYMVKTLDKIDRKLDK